MFKFWSLHLFTTFVCNLLLKTFFHNSCSQLLLTTFFTTFVYRFSLNWCSQLLFTIFVNNLCSHLCSKLLFTTLDQIFWWYIFLKTFVYNFCSKCLLLFFGHNLYSKLVYFWTQRDYRRMLSVTETGWLPTLYMAGIILLFSVTDDISCSLFEQQSSL